MTNQRPAPERRATIRLTAQVLADWTARLSSTLGGIWYITSISGNYTIGANRVWLQDGNDRIVEWCPDSWAPTWTLTAYDQDGKRVTLRSNSIEGLGPQPGGDQ